MIVGKAELALGEQHPVRFDAADDALLQVDAGSRNVRAGGSKHADHAGTSVRRAAHHLDQRAGAGIDHADLEAIGVRMLLRRNHLGDLEWRELGAAILDALDLKPDHGELVDDLGERGAGLQMLLQP